jgi:hypothetical protein
LFGNVEVDYLSITIPLRLRLKRDASPSVRKLFLNVGAAVNVIEPSRYNTREMAGLVD